MFFRAAGPPPSSRRKQLGEYFARHWRVTMRIGNNSITRSGICPGFARKFSINDANLLFSIAFPINEYCNRHVDGRRTSFTVPDRCRNAPYLSGLPAVWIMRYLNWDELSPKKKKKNENARECPRCWPLERIDEANSRGTELINDLLEYKCACGCSRLHLHSVE